MELARPAERGDARCPYCHDALGGEATALCDGCGAAHHRACWEELGRCASCPVARVVDPVPVGLRVEERDGALVITRRPRPVDGGAVVVGLLLVGAVVFAAAAFRALLGGDAAALAPVLLGLILSAGLARTLLSAVVGRDVLTVTPEALTLHIWLLPAQRVPRAGVSGVHAAGPQVVVRGAGSVTWAELEADEAAWIAARVRRHLGLV